MGKMHNFAELARIRRMLKEDDLPLPVDYALTAIDMGFMEDLRCPRCGSLDTREGAWCNDCGQAI